MDRTVQRIVGGLWAQLSDRANVAGTLIRTQDAHALGHVFVTMGWVGFGSREICIHSSPRVIHMSLLPYAWLECHEICFLTSDWTSDPKIPKKKS